MKSGEWPFFLEKRLGETKKSTTVDVQDSLSIVYNRVNATWCKRKLFTNSVICRSTMLILHHRMHRR